MVDDPCDELPDLHWRWLWGRVMLDRETNPVIRRSIKTAMNTHYGRLPRLPDANADPFDSWDRHTFTASIYSPPLATCPRCYRVIINGQPCPNCEG